MGKVSACSNFCLTCSGVTTTEQMDTCSSLGMIQSISISNRAQAYNKALWALRPAKSTGRFFNGFRLYARAIMVRMLRLEPSAEYNVFPVWKSLDAFSSL